jgi:hypothetical protein
MGVQNARRKGKRLGRPPIKKLSCGELEQARKDRRNGNLSLRVLAKIRNISLGDASGDIWN